MSLSGMIQSLGVSCDIMESTTTSDAGGFPIRTYTLKQSNVECAIFPVGADSDSGTTRTFEVTGSRRSLMLHKDNHMQKRIVDLVEVE